MTDQLSSHTQLSALFALNVDIDNVPALISDVIAVVVYFMSRPRGEGRVLFVIVYIIDLFASYCEGVIKPAIFPM